MACQAPAPTWLHPVNASVRDPGMYSISPTIPIFLSYLAISNTLCLAAQKTWEIAVKRGLVSIFESSDPNNE